jgi:hypothetical protein
LTVTARRSIAPPLPNANDDRVDGGGEHAAARGWPIAARTQSAEQESQTEPGVIASHEVVLVRRE